MSAGCPACAAYTPDVTARITDGGNRHWVELTRIRAAEAAGVPIAQIDRVGVWAPDRAAWAAP